jgi:hypothetical protein
MYNQDMKLTRLRTLHISNFFDIDLIGQLIKFNTLLEDVSIEFELK